MFLRRLVKLNNSISIRNFAPQMQVKIKKRSLPHSGSISVRNFGFFVAQWILLAKISRGWTYFAPFSVRPEGAPPPLKIDAYDSTCYVSKFLDDSFIIVLVTSDLLLY